MMIAGCPTSVCLDDHQRPPDALIPLAEKRKVQDLTDDEKARFERVLQGR